MSRGLQDHSFQARNTAEIGEKFFSHGQDQPVVFYPNFREVNPFQMKTKSCQIHIGLLAAIVYPVAFLLVFATTYLPAQSVLFESNKAMEAYGNGAVQITGSLAFRDSSLMVTADDQLVTIGTLSYLRITSNTFVDADRTLILSGGTMMGQILYLECVDGSWQLFDNQSFPNNVNTAGTRNFDPGDIIQLMWNGVNWLEVHFSDN